MSFRAFSLEYLITIIFETTNGGCKKDKRSILIKKDQCNQLIFNKLV